MASSSRRSVYLCQDHKNSWRNSSFISAKKRDAKRDTPDKYKQVYDLYLQHRKENTPQHRIASSVGEEADLPASTVRRWQSWGIGLIDTSRVTCYITVL